jgi:hypothetical protein
VKENGNYKYLQQSYEVTSDHGSKEVYTDIYTLHTTADLEADKRYARAINDNNHFNDNNQIDLSSSPFWVTARCDGNQSLNFFPVKNGNDIIKIHNEHEWEGFLDRDELAWQIQHLFASHEAENNTIKEQSMSDEHDEIIEGAEQEASFEAPGESVEASEHEPMTAEEQAFLNTIHARKQVAESITNGSHPCLPGADGYADTNPAVNLTNGTRYHGANLLMLKDFQKRNGFPTAEYATGEAVQKSGIPIRKGEHGVLISFDQKNEAGQWEKKNVRLFNVAQTARPWEFRKYAEGLAAAEEQRKQSFLKSQFGDSYQAPEKKERAPGPEISCNSTEPERYLAQYLAAVSLGSKFKVTQQQAGEFSEKLNNQLFEKTIQSQKGEMVSDPFKLSKICNAAGFQCREVIKELKQPQPKQEQRHEQKHSRHI